MRRANQHHLCARRTPFPSLPSLRASTVPNPRKAPGISHHLQEHDVQHRLRRPAAQPAAALAPDEKGEAAEATGPTFEIHLATGGGRARSAMGRRPGHVPTGCSSMPNAALIDCILLKLIASSLRGQCRHS